MCVSFCENVNEKMNLEVFGNSMHIKKKNLSMNR